MKFCPIHKSVSCCGREHLPKPRLIRLGMQRVEDRDHPREYRELRSPAEVRKPLNCKIVEQDRKCAIRHEEFTDYNDIVPDHGSQGDGRSVEGRPSGQHPGNLLVVSPSMPANAIAPSL